MTEYHVCYVSPFGCDTWSGALPAPNAAGTDGPFATITAARDAIRALKVESAFTQPVRVLLRGGVYSLTETLVFLPEDSGTAECPITYAAYPSEQPVLSGGQVLTGWEIGEHQGVPCWRTHRPDVAAGEWIFAQLFVNGERRCRPRLPKTGYYRFTGLPDGRCEDWYATTRHANYAPGDLEPWECLDEVELVALKWWFENHLYIESLDESAQVVTFTAKTINSLSDEGEHLARYYVENVAEALSEPGEWYLDRRTGVLTYLPLPGETPENVEVVAPRRPCLLQLLGDTEDGAKVRHLRFENLAFRYAEWRLPRENVGAGQAAFCVPGALQLRGAEHCALLGCEVSRIGHYAIEVQKGSYGNRILGCTLFDLGGGGVKVNHERPIEDRVTGTMGFAGMDTEALGWGPAEEIDTMPPLESARGMATEVADCTIRDGGKIFHSSVGVWIGDSGRNRVHHNEICQFNYSGISAGWHWHYRPSMTVDNHIEFNHVHHIGQRTLSDMGAIYMLGAQPGTVVRGNIVHDVETYGYGGWGIYLDQGSSQMRVEDNLVYRCKVGCFHMTNGQQNVVRNNIFALGGDCQIARSWEESLHALTFEGNIVYSAGPKLFGLFWGNNNFTFDRNLYWQASADAPLFYGMSWQDWQALGHDRQSRIADPLFANPEDGDFTLRDDSPAWAFGFQPLDAAQVGPRSQPSCVDESPRAPIIHPTLELGTVAQPSEAMAIYNTGDVAPGTLPLPVDSPIPLTLTLWNRGTAPAHGTVQVQLLPEEAGTLDGGAMRSYALAPAERMTVPLRVTLSKLAERAVVQARSDGQFDLRLALRAQRAISLPRWERDASFGARMERLVAEPASVIRTDLYELGTIRWAMTAEAMLLRADVVDRRIAPDATGPWCASSLELFVRVPEEKEQAQLFLLPGTDMQPAQALCWREAAIHAADAVILRATPTAEGYRLEAAIPIELLGIPADASAIICEIVLHTYPTIDGGLAGKGLFGVMTEVAIASAHAETMGKGPYEHVD